MNILLIHQNFPGQFRNLIPAWRAAGHVLVAIHAGDENTPFEHVSKSVSDSPHRGNAQGVHRWASDFESKMIRAEACANACKKLKNDGFEPDVILAHPGWGESLLVRAVFPKAKLVCLMEFFYRMHGQDMNFDPEFPCLDLEAEGKLLAKNANLLLAMESMDFGVAPTAWQASTMPSWLAPKIRVIHEGIDTEICAPDATARIIIPSHNIALGVGDEILTFVARNLEPVRGYHYFMRALPEIMRRRPNAKIFIVGGDGVSYGSHPEEGSYRNKYLKEVSGEIDPKRVFFLGEVSYAVFIRLMQVTRCHVYLTYPFVLSWSMLEAMSAGALIVGSNTGPVKDVIKHGVNGMHVDFFDSGGLSEQVCEVLSHPEKFEAMRKAGRSTIIKQYDLKTVCLPGYEKLLAESVSA